MQHLIDRFISYVTIDTESDPNSKSTPSTKKQLILALQLVEELKAIGLTEVTIDKNGYVMGTLPANVDHEVPTIGFVSHYDTTPDFTGANVKPQIIENYDGKDIVLNETQNIRACLICISLGPATMRKQMGILMPACTSCTRCWAMRLPAISRGCQIHAMSKKMTFASRVCKTLRSSTASSDYASATRNVCTAAR